jgi:hypothetical protein
MTKIGWREWLVFRAKYYSGHSWKNQRLGQAFCSAYNITDPALFHLIDDRSAEEYIMDEYVELENHHE